MSNPQKKLQLKKEHQLFRVKKAPFVTHPAGKPRVIPQYACG